MVELRRITDDNYREVIKLEVHDNQTGFVARNIYSLAQAYVALSNQSCIPMPYAIYADETLVGFIMLSYDQADEDDPEDETVYSVWRLMIDKRYQGKGYGRHTMVKALDLIRTYPHGKADLVVLSYEPENAVAKALYASLGFVETGEIMDGELVAVLRL